MTHVSAAREVTRPNSSAARVPLAVPDFDEFYDNYADFVWRNARRLGVSLGALDDVVQDVFLVAHRKLGEVVRPEALRAWMLSIVIRVVRDYRRRLRRKDPQHRANADVLEPDQLPDTHTSSPLTSAEKSDAVRLLNRVLGELDDAKREAFVLAELEELTELEIAEILGERPNTVHSRLRAARIAFDQAVLRHRSRDEWRLR